MTQYVTKKDDARNWYILRHPNPTLIDDIFSRRKTVSLTAVEQESPLPAFDYYIPFCDIQFRPSLARPDAAYTRDGHYEARLDGEALRSDLHNFLFVRAGETFIETLLHRSWNKSLKSPIRAVRNRLGERIRVSAHQMELFRNAIRQKDFQICEGMPTTAEVREGDEVLVIDGPMKGGGGIITEIRERQGRLTLTVAFNMFDDKFRISVPGISLSHVRLLSSDAGRLITDNVISNFETELIELLCHRHGEHGTADLNKSDLQHLRFLYRYEGIVFEQADDNARFTALMLICAYLMNDAALVEQRTRQVLELLGGVTRPATDLQCYLLTALFIATHDITLRPHLKAYRQSHPQCPLSIRRLISIAKKIKCR